MIDILFNKVANWHRIVHVSIEKEISSTFYCVKRGYMQSRRRIYSALPMTSFCQGMIVCCSTLICSQKKATTSIHYLYEIKSRSKALWGPKRNFTTSTIVSSLIKAYYEISLIIFLVTLDVLVGLENCKFE